MNSLLTRGLAGIQPIDVQGIENVSSLALSLSYNPKATMHL